jgi:hypothetical protein
VTLAGHDKGEQVFMDELIRTINADNRLTTLVIIAGGLFTLNPNDLPAFRRGRQDFYRSLRWNSEIVDRVGVASSDREYSALHIRHTDRSREAPTQLIIQCTLRDMKRSGSATSLFIATDTSQGRVEWTDRSRALGFDPWSVADTEFARSARAGGISAAVDWIVLSRSSFLAYPGASTFSAEACVANGGFGIAMYASSLTQVVRSSREVLRSAVTYPARHGWGSRQR